MIHYKNLTEEEQLKLLRYCLGEYHLCDIDHYGMLKNAPLPKPDPHKLFISSLLDIDFEEFYNSEHVKKVCQYVTKNQDKFPPSTWWFVGDNVQDVIWDEFRDFTKKPKKVEIMLEDIKVKLDQIYQGYLIAEQSYEESLIPPIPTEEELLKDRIALADKCILSEMKVNKLQNRDKYSNLKEYVDKYLR